MAPCGHHWKLVSWFGHAYSQQRLTLKDLVYDWFYYFRLLNNEGALLAYSGYGDKDAAVTAAIACNIWTTLQKSGTYGLVDDRLEFVLLDCGVGISSSYFLYCYNVVKHKMAVLLQSWSKLICFTLIVTKDDRLFKSLRRPFPATSQY